MAGTKRSATDGASEHSRRTKLRKSRAASNSTAEDRIRERSSRDYSGTRGNSSEEKHTDTALNSQEDKGVRSVRPIEGSSGSAEDVQSDPNERSTLKVRELKGDLFDAPDHTVLVHACNCKGSWGAGIAAAFRRKYPEAFKRHKTFCEENKKDKLLGTAQLILPSEKKGPKHWVGCLFTSVGFGMRKASPADIVKATKPAMEDLLRQIARHVADGDEIGQVRICYINSGLFAVPWAKSKETLQEIMINDINMPNEVVAYSRD